jgi:phosphohistidine swiveling domain-containing protein
MSETQSSTRASTKASRLQQLSKIVSVPVFTVISRNDRFDPAVHMAGYPSCQYMVRSSSSAEDQADFSHAGQSLTLGPVSPGKVAACIEQLRRDDSVDEIIIQQYVDASHWGVAFCFSEESMLIEYSAIFEGVTSGQVSPFTALLPTEIERYRKLQQELLTIYRRFGPCDVEFVNLDEPGFVQVRPITRDIAFDASYVRLKMGLQEYETACWHENDVCRMLSERDDYSEMLADLYLDAVAKVYSEHFRRKLVIPEPAFMRISEQFFMAGPLQEQLIPGTWGTIRLAFKLPALLATIRERSPRECSLNELMYDSVLLSLAWDLNGKQDVFNDREAIRVELEQRMTKGSISPDFRYDTVLSDTIHLDKKTCCWITLEHRDSQGIVVVAGDFDVGPYFIMEDRQQAIPPGVIVVTRQLYPEIGQSLKNIRAIICEHGALSAHVAILAREYQVPLKIQASIDAYWR